jgi:CheY-like chemotaxis protein
MSFNDIGCRGIATLMRSLVGCESITSLGLSGNIVKISGAIAMGFALAQHPRLSVLELDNCCLSQVAQCHIVAGIISNRWVPMKVMHGFRAGPPMVAIGALEVMAQHLPNEECFRLRRDIQMKTLLQWMENNRNSSLDSNLLTNEMISGAHEATGAPSQSAYLRMLDWLGRIPFDSDELLDLRKYFYDIGGGEEQKSEMNLKHRGDILAALASDVVEEILESDPIVYSGDVGSIGLDLDKTGDDVNEQRPMGDTAPVERNDDHDAPRNPKEVGVMSGTSIAIRGNSSEATMSSRRNSLSSISMSMGRSESHHSTGSHSATSKSDIQFNARITMFPQFANKLENLKAVAQEMMDNEPDPVQQDVIAQQFAEASLTILRQLRYHCMENGLDGWRQGKLRRKVLIVDDSIVTRKLVARAFERVNFIVDTAENGVEGVNKMKESIYDIAFMDIDMPVMNGFDATKALRMWEDAVRPGARQPICALTAAHVDDFDRSELMKFRDAGLNVMESKPCNIPRLFKVVDDVSPMFSDLSISANHFGEYSEQGY